MGDPWLLRCPSTPPNASNSTASRSSLTRMLPVVRYGECVKRRGPVVGFVDGQNVSVEFVRAASTFAAGDEELCAGCMLFFSMPVEDSTERGIGWDGREV